jgi:hypothetical protein
MLHYDWYIPVIAETPQGLGHIGLCQPNIEELIGFPQGSLPGVETQAQFVLAHEMGHALRQGNGDVYSSFMESVELPPSWFAWLSDNPLIFRNRFRSGFAEEVFSDVLAAHLYSPALLNQEMSEWIAGEMRGSLR